MSANANIIKEAVRRSLQSGMLTPALPLKVPQLEGLEGYSSFLNDAPEEDNRAYADMATGSGKTGLFSVVTRHAHEVARENGLGSDFRTIIVEPTLPLLTQTRGMLVEAAPELERAIGFYGGGEKDLSKPVSIVTYDAWLSLLESGELSDENASFHINDEAHHSLSERRRRLLDEKLSGAIHFGVTASSQYDAYKTVGLTHRNRIYTLDLPEAIERGFLTDYVHVQHYVMRILPDMLKKEEQLLSNGEFTLIKRLEWAKLVARAYATMVDGISGEPLSDKVGIAFAADTRAADGLAVRLNNDPTLQRKARELGFKNVAVSIHSIGYSPKIQDALLEQFMNGDFMMAVGDKKFQVGFDYSRIKFVASYPGNSPVDTIQEIGRATRPYIDLRTGRAQGTVIMEAIPYIGNVDPEKNKKARDEALAKAVTAYRILGRTLVFGPGRESSPSSDSSGRKGGERKSIILSPECEVETYITEEETLTISSQIDAAYERRQHLINKGDLTEDQIVSWIRATQEKTGRLPTSNDGTVYGYQADGSIEVVPDETWSGISQSLGRGRRGLIKEHDSLIADGLFDLKKKHRFATDKEDLTEDQIVSWIRATQEKTGRLPTQTDMIVYGYQAGGSIETVPDETWKAIDACITNARRGLVKEDGSLIATSFSDLKKKHGFGKGLAEEQIVSWIRATLEKTGKVPTSNDKAVYGYQADNSIDVVSGETWIGIHKFLQRGTRGLVKADGSLIADGLSDLKKKHGFATDKGDLTEEQIVSWIKATLEKTGKVPATGDKTVYGYQTGGGIEIVPGETWLGINQALKNGHRGLAKKDGTLIAVGLFDLRKKHGFINSKPSVRPTEEQTTERQGIPSVENDTGLSPSIPLDPAEIARQAVTNLFSEFSNDLVARVAAAVVEQLKSQQALEIPTTKPVETIPDRRRRVVRRTATPTAEESPIAAIESQVAFTQKVRDSKFSTFDTPLFTKPDARGDSMFSLLTNAERAFHYNDPIGLRANLRKFVEVFIHRTIMTIDDKYLNALQLAGSHHARIEKIVRDYGYTCATVELSESRGPNRREPRLELVDLTRAFRDLTAVLVAAKPETFSSQIRRMVMDVVEAGGDVHFQIKDQGRLNDAQLLQYSYDIAKWFDAQFCNGAIVAGVAHEQIIATQALPVIPEVIAEEDERPLRIPVTVLKALGVTEQKLVEEIQGSHGQNYRAIAEFVEEWTQEAPVIKEGRNQVCIQLYGEAAPVVAQLVEQGKNIQEIVAELDKQGIGHDPRSGAPIKWNANLLLRGAVLTSTSLPLEVFASIRNTNADRALRVDGTPKLNS